MCIIVMLCKAGDAPGHKPVVVFACVNGKQGQNLSLRLGAPQKVSGIEISEKLSPFSANVWQSCESPHQKVPGSMITM